MSAIDDRDPPAMYWILDVLEDNGDLTRGELCGLIRADDGDIRLSPTAVCHALDHAVRRGFVIEEAHYDLRAREGGCPPTYRRAT